MVHFKIKLNSKSNLPDYEQIIRSFTEAIAAEHVLTGRKDKQVNPAHLIIRQSL